MNGTCTALRHAAAIFCSSETKVVANDPEQWSGRIDIEIDVFAVYGEGDHCSLLFTQFASGGCEAIDFPFAKF